MATLNFHVRHEVTPDRVWEMLDALANNLQYDHITQYDRQLSRLRQLNLITGKGEVTLTSEGIELHRIGGKRLETLWDILHFLHYIQWRESEPTENTMFFTYQAYCNLLYAKHNTSITVHREAFAAEILDTISKSPHFKNELSQLAKGAVSLSTNSLVGVEHWLEKLAPEVIVEGQFALRNYCAPELLLMAIKYVSEITEAQLGIEQPLTEDRRQMVCQICLIEDIVLDQMLDWLYPEYPEFIQPGTSTGSYGRFIRIMKLPQFKDLLA